MTLFWILTTLMIVVTMVAIAPALLRPVLRNESTGDTQNAEIARERLAQLSQAHADGNLDDEEFAQGRAEIERILAEELAAESKQSLSGNPFGRAGLIGIAVFLPILTIVMYSFIGSPQAITGVKTVQQTAGHQQDGDAATASLPDLVDQLAARMQQEPENADGWFLLGRSQMSLGRYQDAVTSFRKVDELSPDTVPVLLALANAEAMAQGGGVLGKPESLVLRVLEMEPDDAVALWLAGNAREEAADFQAAINYWKRAVPLLKENPSEQQELLNRMRRVADQAGIALDLDEEPAAVSLSVRVTLDMALEPSVSPDDTLFIFARAAEGPPMPLAVSRLQASSLPAVVRLDDTMAMMPQMKLSAFDQVKVSAKISKTANATAQPDDLVSVAVVAQPGQEDVIELVIDRQRQE